MDHDVNKSLNFKILIATLLLSATIVLLMSLYVYSCGKATKAKSSLPDPAPTLVVPPSPPCGLTLFQDVLPILTANCVSCHVIPEPITQYDLAQTWASEIKRRINLDVNNREHMPLNTATQLSQGDLATLNKWVNDGALQASGLCTSGAQINLQYIESYILNDLNGLESGDRPQTRYLITAHRLAEDNIAEQAMNKTLNSVNPVGQDLIKLTPIDPQKAIWRFDLRSYDIQAAEIAAIEKGDKINIISNTNNGKLIRGLTQTNKPWFQADAFIDNVQSADVYYTLLQINPNENIFLQTINVNFAGQLANLTNALFIGGNQSVISELKNRLLVRVNGQPQQASYYWQTFDTNDQFVATKNLFSFPLLVGTGAAVTLASVENFNFDASEVIYSLPNGMQAYALFNNLNQRLNAAPLNVVRDTESPITPEIRNANSCSRCHNNGIISMQDQILAHVTANASQFNANDVQLVQKVYKSQSADNAAFIADQKFYAAALAKIGISSIGRDPITQFTDKYLLDWDVNFAAAFLFLTVDQFKAAVNQSPSAKSQIGQLLTGGTVTFQQFITVLPQLIIDARLFQDGIGE